jgi:hypothetical protein
MGVLFTLVSVGADHLDYLFESFDSGGEFPIWGGTSVLTWASIQTDAGVNTLPGPTVVNGAFRQVVFADVEGIGTVAAGAGLTQAQARAVYLLDASGASIGNDSVPRALTTLCPRDAASRWSLDATSAGITVTAANTTASAAYLRIQLVHSLWR